MTSLRTFIRESNRIEGILRAPLAREIRATERFLALDHIEPVDLERFVEACAPGHVLRSAPGLNVRVGNHIAPPGGFAIFERLSQICGQANTLAEPFELHRAYETLHPFTDGNGRSGRVLWLWMMLKAGNDPYVLHRGFLHTWYYQALAASSERRP